MTSYPWEDPLGARPLSEGGVELRVWAPRAAVVTARVGAREHVLEPVAHGIWQARVDARRGEEYAFVLDGGEELPDPASRAQPHGLRGRSRIVDTAAFAWSDAAWSGVPAEDLVLYELHVGTFTPAGTFDAAIAELPRLRALGVTAIEVMPIAEFPGVRGWGYDGVYLSAAQSSYGGPEGFQRLVDAAHRAGLAVVLDVVYNHVGASGRNAFEAFGPYFTAKHETFWGGAINYDDAQCDPVREWVLQSAEGWVREFHVDGLRLDAIHAIFDDGARPLLAELSERVQAVRPNVVVIAESGLNDPRVIRPRDQGGLGHDAQWADDFHHALHALLTGERDGYYADFGAVADLAKAFRRPFVHDGSWSQFRRRRFGAPAGDRPPHQFVVFAQNHDQVGNRAFGDRLAAELRPLAAFCLLLSPFTPMLFMGEEYGEPAPFQFFTDHIDEEIAVATREGRRREFAAFAAFAQDVPDPQEVATFERSKLTRREDPAVRDLYARLLELRAQLPREEVGTRHDEDGRWLLVARGDWRIAANFASEPRALPADGATEVVLATHTAQLDGDRVTLPPRAGALLR
ncbi:MAG: treZ [Conexibacter sp.]|nr:treZ [Conexibacter sp.]